MTQDWDERMGPTFNATAFNTAGVGTPLAALGISDPMHQMAVIGQGPEIAPDMGDPGLNIG